MNQPLGTSSSESATSSLLAGTKGVSRTGGGGICGYCTTLCRHMRGGSTKVIGASTSSGISMALGYIFTFLHRDTNTQRLSNFKSKARVRSGWFAPCQLNLVSMKVTQPLELSPGIYVLPNTSVLPCQWLYPDKPARYRVPSGRCSYIPLDKKLTLSMDAVWRNSFARGRPL